MILPKKRESLFDPADIRTERNHSKDKPPKKAPVAPIGAGSGRAAVPRSATEAQADTSPRGPGISPWSQALRFAEPARVHSISALTRNLKSAF